MNQVRTVAVIGAGATGRGIAHAAALGGYRTILEDILPASLRRAENEIRTRLEESVELGSVSRSDADSALGRIEFASSLEDAARTADLVIESVPEEFDSKEEIFRLLDRICSPDVFLITNTSLFSVSEIGAVTLRAPRIVGMHLTNPVHKMKVIEIVRGKETDDETTKVAVDFAHRMGKETVLLHESAGFVTSRISSMIANEAFYMLEAGIASAADIDKALKLGLNYGTPDAMAPFEAVDFAGLDTQLEILRQLHSALGERFRPCPLLEKYVDEGRVGRKVGRGVYEYPEILALYDKSAAEKP